MDYALALTLFDILLLSLTFWLTWAGRFWFDVGWGHFDTYLPVYLISVLFFTITAAYEGCYQRATIRDQFLSTSRALKAAIFMFGVLVFAGFALKVTSDYSRLWAVSWALTFTGGLVLNRFFTSRTIQRKIRSGKITRNVVIIGACDQGQRVYRAIVDDIDSDLQVVAFLDDRKDRVPNQVGDVPVVGSVASLPMLLSEETLDLVIVALPWSAHERIEQIKKQLSRFALDVVLATETVGRSFDRYEQLRLGSHMFPKLSKRPINEWAAVLKRAEDIGVALAVLLALWPVLAITALAIKLTSKGPVLFKQNRYGFNNELIRVYKFRSMYADKTDDNASQLASKNDDRITPIGRFIRKTSIDELPQIFNVLEGSMSVVGPRPHATQAKAAGQLYNEVVAEYAERHRMKPGITGWAQVNGWRGETDTEEKIKKRIEFDLYYIANWSLWLDIFIILKTAFVVLFDRKNAY